MRRVLTSLRGTERTPRGERAREERRPGGWPRGVRVGVKSKHAAAAGERRATENGAVSLDIFAPCAVFDRGVGFRGLGFMVAKP